MPIKRITDLEEILSLTGEEYIEISSPSTSVTITATTISALASDNSFNDSGSGFVTAGFLVGDRVVVKGFTTTANNLTVGTVTAVTAAKLTIGGTDGDVIVDESAGNSITISKYNSRRVAIVTISTLFSSGTANVNPQTGTSYTLIGSDANNVVTMDNVSANTVTVPAGVFPVGTVISIIQKDTGTTTITFDTGVTGNGVSAGSADLNGENAAVSLLQIDTDEWNLKGEHGGVA